MHRKEYDEHLKICITEIGLDVIEKIDIYSRGKWMKSICEKNGSTTLQLLRLENLYEVLKEIIRYNLMETKDYFTSNIVKYYTEISILFIHVRMFVLPKLVKGFDIDFIDDRMKSLNYLQMLLSDKNDLIEHKYSFVAHRRYWLYLVESMMDLLEDLQRHFKMNEIIHSFVKRVLSFVSYCYVSHEYPCERDIDFLNSYSCSNGSLRLWSTLIMFIFTKEHSCRNILTTHLQNSILNEDRETDDDIIIYMVTLQNAKYHGCRSLTNLDYTLILRIRNSGVIAFPLRSKIVDNIVKTFYKVHRSGILDAIKNGTQLTDSQKIAINCISLCLLCLVDHHYVLMNEDIMPAMVSLLEDVRPYSTTNIAAMRIAEIILYKLCGYHIYLGRGVKEDICGICLKYLCIDNLSEEIILSLFVIIAFIAVDPSSVPCLNQIISHLNDVIEVMKQEGSDEHLGFSRWELEEAVSDASDLLK